VKTYAVLDGERDSRCYLLEDRGNLVKYDNNTYGTIPVALLVIEAVDIEYMYNNQESTQDHGVVLAKQLP
jgi:hypothetical protein